MTTQQPPGVFLRLAARGAAFLALVLIATPGSASGQKSAASRMAAADSVAARQRFLEMFARAYFPGRTAQLLVVPREGEFVTRPDSNVTFMHGSPWEYDVAIPILFAGPAVRAGTYAMPAAQQDVAPTLA